jgi:hypothetical protein
LASARKEPFYYKRLIHLHIQGQEAGNQKTQNTRRGMKIVNK